MHPQALIPSSTQVADSQWKGKELHQVVCPSKKKKKKSCCVFLSCDQQDQIINVSKPGKLIATLKPLTLCNQYSSKCF